MFDHLDDEIPFRPDAELRRAVTRAGTRRRARQRAGATAVSVALPVALLTGGLAAYGRWSNDRIEHLSVAAVPQTDADGRPASLNLDDLRRPFTILVVGTDTRAGVAGPGRTDTIMLAEVDVPAGAVRIVSVPRDLWVPLAGGAGEGRVNEALGHGRETLIATVNQTLGVTVDHYAEVDIEGFAHLVDAAGGVPVLVDTAIRDEFSGLDLGPGCHVLDGRAALAAVRARHLSYRDADGTWRADPSSDLGRIARQQVLVASAIGQAARQTAGPDRLVDLARVVAATAALDDHLGLDDLAGLGQWTATLPPAALRAMTPPVVRASRPGGVEVLELAPGAAPAVQRFLRGEGPEPAAGWSGAVVEPAAPDAHLRPAPGGCR
jgi:LCP family protein required for cell wall assembly